MYKVFYIISVALTLDIVRTIKPPEAQRKQPGRPHCSVTLLVFVYLTSSISMAESSLSPSASPDVIRL